jgi:hypothetical protein
MYIYKYAHIYIFMYITYIGDVVPKVNYEEKIVSLEKDIRDLKDRVMRSLAEEENVSYIYIYIYMYL